MLERKKTDLLTSLSEPMPAAPILRLEDLVSEVEEFIVGFDREFDVASVEEKKRLLKRCLSKIVVDRNDKKVRVYVKQLPVSPAALSNTVESTQDRYEARESVMSDRSARNRT